ncbi:MAG: hypothetical protein AAGG48_29600 [Planctomycetota bacterium]
MSDASGFIHDPVRIAAEKLAFIKYSKIRRGWIGEFTEAFRGASLHQSYRTL